MAVEPLKGAVTMPNVLKAMIERRDELRGGLNAVPEFREYELLESFIAQYESVAVARASVKQTIIADRPARAPRKKRFTVTDAAGAAIEDVGHPLPLQDLTEALPRFGKTVTGKRPDINLSSAMSRDARFISVRWAGANSWWFRDRELPSEADASGGGAADAPAAEPEDHDVEEEHSAAA